MLYRCAYCRRILIFRLLKFEDNLICKSCFEIVPNWTFKIRKDTLLGSIYKTRYENIIHAKDNMIDMVLDKNTLKQKYPECKVFTFYDG